MRKSFTQNTSRLIILALTVTILLSGCSTRVPEQLTPAEALEAKNSGALIIDIRDEADFTQFHIPNAINIPLAELSSRMEEIPQDEHIILVCTLGRTSYEARDILLEAGFASVSSLQGGVTFWYDSGYPGIFGQ